MVLLPKVDKAKEKADRLKEQLWPEVSNDEIWNRKRRDGYISVPRTLPMIMSIIDSLTNGKPAGLAYMGLWCRSVNECVVEIKDPNGMAYEIGYTGERRKTPWNDRMAALEKLGFIKTADGASGKYGFILLLNPYKVIHQLWKKKQIQPEKYNVLLSRAQDIGADDLEEEHKRLALSNNRGSVTKKRASPLR